MIEEFWAKFKGFLPSVRPWGGDDLVVGNIYKAHHKDSRAGWNTSRDGVWLESYDGNFYRIYVGEFYQYHSGYDNEKER